MRAPPRHIRVAAVCFFTVLGHLVGFFGIAIADPSLLVLSLLVDTVDGRAARRWGAVSRLGAALDFWGDCVLCIFALSLFGSGALVLAAASALVIWWANAWATGVRFSGRAAVFVVLVVGWSA